MTTSGKKFPTKNFWGKNGKAISVKSQQDKILDYLNKYGRISSSEAYHKLGISQLPVRIAEMNKIGIKVNSQCHGKKDSTLRYYLEVEE